MQAHLVS